ncbi:MAG TPA: TMEM175 family protein [Caulobacteraceae bacterium]|jgi:uncharacterized membrane protein
MVKDYNRIAGHGLDRLAALSDGVFAVAMTLIVLDIRIPETVTVHSEAQLCAVLVGLAPRLGMYLTSFLTLGIFWVGQQTQLNQFERSDRDLSWIHLVFLAWVALMPFSTMLLARFITFRVALAVYWLNILLLGATLYWSWFHAGRAGLAKADLPPAIGAALRRRIVVAQALYAFGALLCLINPYWSIGFILLVQLNYAVAPTMKRGERED